MIQISEVIKARITEVFGDHNAAARATGVNPRSIYRFLRGERSINTSSIQSIWPHLNLDLEPEDINDVCKEHGFEEAVRYAVRNSGVSELQFANKAGIAQPVLWRFMHKGSAMRLQTLDLVWAITPIMIVGAKPAEQLQ